VALAAGEVAENPGSPGLSQPTFVTGKGKEKSALEIKTCKMDQTEEVMFCEQKDGLESEVSTVATTIVSTKEDCEFAGNMFDIDGYLLRVRDNCYIAFRQSGINRPALFEWIARIFNRTLTRASGGPRMK
jgi:hypothetical protein